MDREELERWEGRLEEFLGELTAGMGRLERRYWAEVYVKGLLLDGQRKSVEPLAVRVLGAQPHSPQVQGLQQFVSQSPWAAEELLQRIAQRWQRATTVKRHRLWIIDETGLPKAGEHSAGVAWQYCGALGKLANCQVAVSLNVSLEDGSASQPLAWRLYLPEQWVDDPLRRQQAGVPEAIGYQTKPELALALIDQALAWGLTRPRAILCDEVYGGGFQWRSALRERKLGYAVQVGSDSGAWLEPPSFVLPAPKRKGGRQPKRYQLVSARPESLEAIARNLPQQSWQEVCWRKGSRGPLCSRFARVTVWASHDWQRCCKPEYVAETLLVEWPSQEPSPTKYWILWTPQQRQQPDQEQSPAEGSLCKQVARAKGRWRIEQDYRELKDELGLDHFEGRSFSGWHHHAALCTLAFAFLREAQNHLAQDAPVPERPRDKSARSGAKKKSAPSRRSSNPATHPPDPAGQPDSALRPVPLVQNTLRRLVLT